MDYLPDSVIHHLREAVALPDFSATRYELIGETAHGGMGTVYAGHDKQLGRRVALKVLNILDTEGQAAVRMAEEARILARLEHPGIVPIHDLGTLPIHRDIKPENIMVGQFGEVLVLDWGVAKVTDLARAFSSGSAAADSQTAGGTVIGTRGYMSPEQAAGNVDQVDARSDIYSLGLTLAALVPPLPAPKRLRAIWQKAASPERTLRYANVLELSADVERFLSGEPVDAYHESIVERLGRLVTHNQTLVLLVSAYLAMRVLLFFFTRR